MFRLSKLTDYGIVLLAQLARAPGDRPQNARELALRAELPVPVVSKVLKLLARGEVLESRRGAHGGYALARPAHRISVAAVIDALEGPVAITECARGPSLCSHEVTCAVRDPIHVLNDVVNKALSTISLADLIDPQFGTMSDLGTTLQILDQGDSPRSNATE